MDGERRTGAGRHLSLLVSGALVLLIGGLGLVAGHAAGDRAREVHRDDRLALQRTLAGLVQQYALMTAAEVTDDLAAEGTWSARAGEPASAERLHELVDRSRSLDAGGLLMSAAGAPLASWSVAPLPDPADPAWAPLRAAVLRRTPGVVPLTGVLTTSRVPVMGMGLPVPLDDGSTGLVVGLWHPRTNGLQQYVGGLTYGRTGHGYVVDATGLVVAGPEPSRIGHPLPVPELGARVLGGGSGIVDTDDGDALVTSYAPAGRTGWTALTPQDRDEFQGALERSSRLVQVLVVALLLIAGTGLVAVHRKREVALETIALYDELTGVYNRRGWFALADHELTRARRQGSSRVLLFVDLDGLKQVNDQLGHREGDRAIVAAARVLTAASRASDLVGRLGGDEFVLLLGDDGEVDVARARVLQALAAHNAGSADGFELRLSLGAEVWFPDHSTTLTELVRRADEDMYEHKASRPERSAGVVRVPSPRAAEQDTPVG